MLRLIALVATLLLVCAPPALAQRSTPAQILNPSGAAGEEFGRSVAIFGDTMLIGATGDSVGANANQGRAYIYRWTGTGWALEATLTAADGAANDLFGTAVALSADTAIVGATRDNVGANLNQGSATVFTRSGTTWTQQATLTATGGAASDSFGISVTLSGDTAIVGANFDDVGANGNQGSAYVFTRSGTTWTQQAQLNSTGGAANDQFGYSVALSVDTAIVGAFAADVGTNFNQGSAYVFVRSGTIWTQQAQLTAADGAASDLFGISVTLSGDTAIVGGSGDDIGVATDRGSAYVFNRSGTRWTQQAQLLAADGGTFDNFGNSVSISGDTVVVGAPSDDTGTNTRGSAYTFDIAFNDLSLAHNDSIDTAFPFLAAALVPAQSGQQITAMEGAWRTITTLDTTGRSLTLAGYGDIRWPSSASLTLGAASTLTAPTGSVLEIFGALNAAGTNTVTADSFFLGSRAALNTQIGAALTITTPVATLEGQTNLASGATLILSTPVTHLDFHASVLAPFGSNGVISRGSFDCAIDSNARFDLSIATLQLEGTAAEQTLEVMSTDIGPDASGFDRNIAGHYPIGTLELGPSPSTIRLVDARDNDGLGQAACEALYVDTLRIDAGSHLINTSCRIYYNTLINNGAVDVPANLIRIAMLCPGDFNSDGAVDFFDYDDFVTCFEGGACPPGRTADFNNDTAIDFFDYDDFVVAFEAGC